MVRWPALACALSAMLCLASPGGAIAAGEGGGGKSAAQQLIEAYTPRLMLREEEDPPCDTDGEQYEATTVNSVLGNPAVSLTTADNDGDETVLKRAPTAADLAGLGDRTTSTSRVIRSATPATTPGTSPS